MQGSQSDGQKKGHSFWHKFGTKKFIFSVAGLAIATWLEIHSKLDGPTWVYALAVIIAGHNAEDVIRAFKGTPSARTS